MFILHYYYSYVAIYGSSIHFNANQYRSEIEDLKDETLCRLVMSKLNNHCEECGPELAGIKDNCTVFLPEEGEFFFREFINKF